VGENVLVSLCCYILLCYWKGLLKSFSFFVLLHNSQLGGGAGLGVLVSLCCYLKVLILRKLISNCFSFFVLLLESPNLAKVDLKLF